MEKELRDLTVGAAIERAKEVIDENRDFYTTPESEGGADEDMRAAARKWKISVDCKVIGTYPCQYDRMTLKFELCHLFGLFVGLDDQDVTYSVEQYGGWAALDDVTVSIWEVDEN